MKKIKKLFGIICLVGSLAILFTGCSNKKTKNSKVEDELSTITIAISSEAKAEKLDATSYDAAMALYSSIYEPLINYGEKGLFTEGLAKAWEISEDGKTYTFHLQEGIKFSDGTKFTSEAVKFTIERAKAKNKTTSLQTLKNLKRIETPDEYTAVLHFTELSNQVLNELCQVRPLRIMSPNSVKDQSIEGKFVEAIGTGPFVVSEITNERTTLVPNSYYAQEHPLNYQIAFQTIEDGNARTSALRSGEIDIAGGTLGNITPEDIAALKKEKDYTSYEFEGTMSHILTFNPENELLQKTNIRKAISMLINKKELSNKKLKGLFRENVQYVTVDNQAEILYDTETANELLATEGYKKNNSGYYANDEGELSFDLVIQTTEFPEWKKKAEIIESSLKKAGIKLNIKTLDMETYYDALWTTKEYDLIFYRTYTDAFLPYYFMTSLYYNNEGKSGVMANDPKLCELLDNYATLIDLDEQQAVFDQIFNEISDQALGLPIEYLDEEFVTSKKVDKFYYSGLSDAPIDFKQLVVK